MKRADNEVTEGLRESVRRLDHLQDTVTASARFTTQEIRAGNAAVAQCAPAGSGLYASAAPTRTLWTALWDTSNRSVEIDFYLGEREVNGEIEIERSATMEFALR